jgi:hypothetical protein
MDGEHLTNHRDVPLILEIVVHEYYEAVLERVRDIVML